MTLREIQQPIKERYAGEPSAARITLRATGSSGSGAMSCSVDIGRALYAAGAHPGVGGAGTAACSGDLAPGRPGGLRAAHLPDGRREHGARRRGGERSRSRATSTCGARSARPASPSGSKPSGSASAWPATGSTAERLVKLKERTERYCVVLQTLLAPPAIEALWDGPAGLP